MKSSNSEVVVLILSTGNSAYDDFKSAIRNTWLKKMESIGVKCFFYEGDSDYTYLDCDTIKLPCGDGLKDCSTKLRMAMKFVIETYPNISMIYRTNLSSYIDVNAFNRYISTIDNPNTVYRGVVGSAKVIPEFFYSNKYIRGVLNFLRIGPSIRFCSGSGMFIGKSFFTSVILVSKFDRYVDDIMVRLAIGQEPDSKYLLDRFDFTSGYDPRCSNVEFLSRVDRGLFHYRFKTDNRVIDAKLLEFIDDDTLRFRLCVRGKHD